MWKGGEKFPLNYTKSIIYRTCLLTATKTAGWRRVFSVLAGVSIHFYGWEKL